MFYIYVALCQRQDYYRCNVPVLSLVVIQIDAPCAQTSVQEIGLGLLLVDSPALPYLVGTYPVSTTSRGSLRLSISVWSCLFPGLANSASGDEAFSRLAWVTKDFSQRGAPCIML